MQTIISQIGTSYHHEVLGMVFIKEILKDGYVVFIDLAGYDFKVHQNELSEISLTVEDLEKYDFRLENEPNPLYNKYAKGNFVVYYRKETKGLYYQTAGHWVEIAYLSQFQTILSYINQVQV